MHSPCLIKRFEKDIDEFKMQQYRLVEWTDMKQIKGRVKSNEKRAPEQGNAMPLDPCSGFRCWSVLTDSLTKCLRS